MEKKTKMIAYGPVPSRRLGQSMGINNIPPKFCTYNCVYCQLGRTNNKIVLSSVSIKQEKPQSDFKAMFFLYTSLS